MLLNHVNAYAIIFRQNGVILTMMRSYVLCSVGNKTLLHNVMLSWFYVSILNKDIVFRINIYILCKFTGSTF